MLSTLNSNPDLDSSSSSDLLSARRDEQLARNEAKRDSEEALSKAKNGDVAEQKEERKGVGTLYERKREKKHSSSNDSFSFEDKLVFRGDESLLDQSDLREGKGNNIYFYAEEKGTSLSAKSTSRSPASASTTSTSTSHERRKSFSFASPHAAVKGKFSSSDHGSRSNSDDDDADVDAFISESSGLKAFNYARRSKTINTNKEASLDLEDYEVSFGERADLHELRKVSLTHDFAPKLDTPKNCAIKESEDEEGGDIYSDLRLKYFQPGTTTAATTKVKSNTKLSADDRKTSFKRPHDSIGISMGNFQLESTRDLRGRDGLAAMEEAERTGGNDDWESEQPVKRVRGERSGYSSCMLTGKDYF